MSIDRIPAIDNLKRTLIRHSTELYACNGPVPRAVMDELLEAVEAVLRDHDADTVLGPVGPVRDIFTSAVQDIFTRAADEVLAEADSWHADDDEHDDDEPSEFRQWQQDVTA